MARSHAEAFLEVVKRAKVDAPSIAEPAEKLSS